MEVYSFDPMNGGNINSLSLQSLYNHSGQALPQVFLYDPGMDGLYYMIPAAASGRAFP